MRHVKFNWTSAAIFIAAFCVLSACTQAVPKADAVFLVRHAEKTTEKTDPGLTQEGKARALALAHRLGGEGITQFTAVIIFVHVIRQNPWRKS